MTKYKVPALEKTIAILNLIASGKRKYTITEIHKELDISKTTVFSIMNVLDSHELVKKNQKGEFEIGIKLYELGMSYVSDMDLVKIARPHLVKLMEEIGYTVHLGVLEEGEILYIDKVEPDSFIKFSTYPGLRSKFHITSLGKAIAAYLDLEELMDILDKQGLSSFTSNTITSEEQLVKDLKETKKNGYSLEDEEGEVGVRCIGAPIFDGNGNVIASISIAGHTSQLTDQLIEEIAKQVINSASIISKNLGTTTVDKDNY